jgi:hypothetical protein
MNSIKKLISLLPNVAKTLFIPFFQICFEGSQLACQHKTRGSLKTLGRLPCFHLIHKFLTSATYSKI